MGQMPAGGIAMPHRHEDSVEGGDWREYTVAPRGIPDLATHREHGVRWQPRGPLAGEAWQDGGATRDHGGTSWTIGVLMPIHTGDARSIPPSIRRRGRDHEFGLTSCHSTKSQY